MPGPVSESFKGRGEHTPYVPSWCYPNNEPKVCPCGHHEGYHAGVGKKCIHADAFTKCGCTGLPEDCFTTDEELRNNTGKET